MAVEYYPSTSPENPRSRGISPRISFSHDLGQYDVVPVEPHIPLSPSSLSASASFNFHAHQSLHLSPSSADELFSNGVLLPLQSHPSAKSPPPPLPPHPPTPPCDDPKTGEEQSKMRKSSSSASHTSSFWKFRRSRSCNCGSIYTGTLCPILLPRSKSTGSNSSSKRSLVSKEETHQHHSRNLGGVNGGKQRSLISRYQKPPLNKSYGSSGTGLRVSPVLNVSSGNLFGLGSIFRSIGRGEKFNKKKLVI